MYMYKCIVYLHVHVYVHMYMYIIILIAYLHVTCVQCMHVLIHMYICGYNVLYVYLHAHKPIVITITN